MCTVLLLLLSRFSHVWLCVTPETAAYQAPQSLGFSRQEHWSGLPFPSPMYTVNSNKYPNYCVALMLIINPLLYITVCFFNFENFYAQLCPTLCDPMGCSLSGSSIHGIFQVRVLEWIAITFSRYIIVFFFNSEKFYLSLAELQYYISSGLQHSVQ